MDIRSDRRFRFEVERAAVWAAVTRTDQYRQWWPWLHEFDGATFQQGARWHCLVKPPLPYTLRFDIVLTDVVGRDADRNIARARIEGDITGWAELTATDRDGGCELRLVSELSPANRALRVVARVARPVVAFGHDWVLDTGARQFNSAAFHASIQP